MMDDGYGYIAADPVPCTPPPRPHEDAETYLRRTDSLSINGTIFSRRLLQWCYRHPQSDVASRVGWAMDEGGQVVRVERSRR